MASVYETEDDEDEAPGIIATAKDVALKPVELATSKQAQRTYVTSILVAFTGLILFGLAVTAYTLFYWSYIPRIGFERTIHLQFDNVYHSNDQRYDGAGNPYGVVNIAPEVVSAQGYDIFIELVLPRTRDNRGAGNFMLEASLYAAGSITDPVKDTLMPGTADVDNRLAISRRPAILSYRSTVVESLHRLTELHWYLLGWRNEAECLRVSMFEGVQFDRGWLNTPSTLRLDIQSTHRMQVYSAKATFRARFRGLRWLMYNHRIISAIVFIGSFWLTEMIFVGLGWAVISIYLQPSQEVKIGHAQQHSGAIKQEDTGSEKPALSDTERTFPSSSRQQPLRYENPPIKQEEINDIGGLQEVPNKATEADDEDEDADVFLDSGLGTSMESSSARRDSVRKRRGRPGSGDGTG